MPHLTLLAAEHRPNAVARVVGAVVHGNCPLHHRIEASPARLREVEGIGPKRADRAWADQKRIREIMVFLHQHGVGTARAVRIFKTYGADAVQVMSENPYRLARDIRGIGFRTADLIAERLGIEKTAMIRVRAGIAFALTEAMGDGHCGLPTAELNTLAVKLLEVPEDLIASALEMELAAQTVTADSVAGTRCVFLSGLYHAERAVAGHLRRVTGGPLPWSEINPAKALPWAEARTGLTLADSQAEAVRLALRSKTTVITGGPGVGKTTIVKTILRILQAKAVTLRLCAPTGRAAKRMSEATGMEAKTIHRLLEVDPKTFGFRRNEDNPLKCDLLVVDESSMVDVLLMQALLQAVPDQTRSQGVHSALSSRFSRASRIFRTVASMILNHSRPCVTNAASGGLPFFGLSLIATCSRSVPFGVRNLRRVAPGIRAATWSR